MALASAWQRWVAWRVNQQAAMWQPTGHNGGLAGMAGSGEWRATSAGVWQLAGR